MRKIIVFLLATAAALSFAASASADVPNAGQHVNENPTGVTAYCDTPRSWGVPGQFGAWGDFVDGCTSPKVTCPRSSRRGCPITLSAYIWSTDEPPYVKMTQNARVRVFNAGTGRLAWFRDKSCAGDRNGCENKDAATLRPGQSATYQCNGVREHTTIGEPAENTCMIGIKVR
jgi:hypothetical protein